MYIVGCAVKCINVLQFTVASVDVELGDGSTVYVSMLPNPSHLEAVNPVALGKTRARQLTLRDGPYSQGPEPADPTPSSRVLSLQVLPKLIIEFTINYSTIA